MTIEWPELKGFTRETFAALIFRIAIEEREWS